MNDLKLETAIGDTLDVDTRWKDEPDPGILINVSSNRLYLRREKVAALHQFLGQLLTEWDAKANQRQEAEAKA